MIGLGLRLGMGRGASGGGAVAPVVVIAPSIIAQPLVGQAVEIDEGTVTGATSTTYQWYEGAPTTTPVSGATSAGFTPTDAEYGSTLYRRTTYTNAAGSTVVDVAAPGIVAAQFRTDWSNLVAGDTITDVVAAGYIRTSASGTQLTQAAVVSEATAPAGLAVDISATSAAINGLSDDDPDVFFAANSYSTYAEELYLVRHEAALGRFMMRGRTSAPIVSNLDLGPGVSIRIGVFWHQIPGEDPTGSTGTNLGSLTVAKTYWVRHRITPISSTVKLWEYDTTEPSIWNNTRTLAAPPAWRGPSVGARETGSSKRFLYMSSAGNAPAPYPAGYLPP